MVVGSPTKLNLIPSGVMPVVYINQGDAGYDKEFLIYNGDSPYNVPVGVSATIRGKKADGYGVTEAAALTEGSNLVTVTITEQMVAAAGANLYELVFVDTNDLRIATINMVWSVKADALGDSVISDSDLDYATTVMNQLQSVQAFKNQLDTNTSGLAAETAARIAADNLETVARIAADNLETTARNSADNTLQTNINAEASARAAADANLQTQINGLIAPSGSSPSAAEIENARIGVDSTVYSTLGDAIRGQVSNLDNDLERYAEIVSNGFESILMDWENGKYSLTTGNKVSSDLNYSVRTTGWIDSTKAYRILKLSEGINLFCIKKDSENNITYETITANNINTLDIHGDSTVSYEFFAEYANRTQIPDPIKFIKENLWIAFGYPEKMTKTFTAKQFGAKGDGITDDTNAINNAILAAYYCGGGLVYLEKGVYLTSAPIVIMRNVQIIGAGKNITTIKLKTGSNCNVMETYRINYEDTYTGQEWYPSNFSVENLQIDGSAVFTYDTTNDKYIVSGNTAGSGIRIRGSRYILKHLYIHNVARCGAVFNYRSSYVYDTINDSSVFNNSYIDDIGVFGCGNEAFVYNTANDLNIGSLWLTRACLTKERSGLIISDTDPDTLCAFYIGCNLNVNFVHVWNNPYCYGIKIQNSATVVLDTAIMESCAGGFFADAPILNLIAANIYMHDIGYSDANAKYYMHLKNARSTNIANLVFYRDSIYQNENPTLFIEPDNVCINNYECIYYSSVDIGNAIVLNGDRCKIRGLVNVIGVSEDTQNVKIVVNGEFDQLDIDTVDIGGCEGTAVKSVINVTGCAINESLIIPTNIINYGRGELL